MADPVDMVLQLVAAGRITPDEASQLLGALDEAASRQATGGHPGTGEHPGVGADPDPDATAGGPDRATAGADPSVSTDADRGDPGRRAPDDAGRTVRLEVTEDGQVVVDLRLPAALGDLAVRRVPGLSEDQATRIRDAVHRGLVGDILRVIDDGGNGVRISLE
jgi:hypothetical protein